MTSDWCCGPMKRIRTWLFLVVILAAAMVVVLWPPSERLLHRQRHSLDNAISSTLVLANQAVPGRAGSVAMSPDADHFWPQWRGPLGTGVAPHADPPVHWSETKNIRWKKALPGKAHSTPVIWGNQIFITTAVPFGEAHKARYSGVPGAHDEFPITHRHKFLVMALDRGDGTILWQRTMREELPHAGGHYTASLASSSPVTDGEYLVAYFGSWGLYCLDLNGHPKWQKSFGRMHTLHGHGEGSSPALYRDTLIVNWDHEGKSFLVAFDLRTGDERWKVGRDGGTSWTTPIVVEHGGKPQVIVSGSKRVRSYDLATGSILWECSGMSVENVVASPVAGHGMVYAGCSYDKQTLLAIALSGAKGDITGTRQVIWRRTRRTPYVPSLLLYGESLYFHSHFQGILNRVSAHTGDDQPGALRLSGIGNVFASPVAAAGRIYITDRDGTTLVLSHENPPKVLAINRLNDSFSASPAIAGGELYLRGQNLYCIAEE